MNQTEFNAKQSPWSNLGRILTDAEWLASKEWRRNQPADHKLATGDVAPDGRFFIGYQRNFRGGELWGDAAALELRRMRWRTCRRRALTKDGVREKFNAARRAEYAASPELRAKRNEAGKKWREANPDRKAASGRRREAAKLSAVHPGIDLQKERDFYSLARRMTRATGRRHTVDHIIPLSAGGFHHHENLQVLPESVNAAKRDNPLWTSEVYKDWRSVPQFLWPAQLVPVYLEKMKSKNP